MQKIFDELIELQRIKIKTCAASIIPNLTDDDLLQPNDFPALENNPYFRYNEGVLEGLMTARMAYLAQVTQDDTKSELFGKMKGTIQDSGDLIASTSAEWDVNN